MGQADKGQSSSIAASIIWEIALKSVSSSSLLFTVEMILSPQPLIMSPISTVTVLRGIAVWGWTKEQNTTTVANFKSQKRVNWEPLMITLKSTVKHDEVCFSALITTTKCADKIKSHSRLSLLFGYLYGCQVSRRPLFTIAMAKPSKILLLWRTPLTDSYDTNKYVFQKKRNMEIKLKNGRVTNQL